MFAGVSLASILRRPELSVGFLARVFEVRARTSFEVCKCCWPEYQPDYAYSHEIF